MSDSPQQILATIPKLVETADAEALAALRDHADKNVRKSVRRALHKLASRGVQVPDGTTRSWSARPGGESLRGSTESVGHIDITSNPGMTHLWWVSADHEQGGAVDMAVVDANDVVFDYATYGQTDGQRGRLLEQWKRVHADRRVPADWVRARLRWSRTQTVVHGRSVPPAMDKALVRIGGGAGNDQRPECFLADVLPAGPSDGDTSATSLLASVGVPAWPVVVDAAALSAVISEASKLLRPEGTEASEDEPQPSEAEIEKSLVSALETNHGLRGDIRGRVANLLEDAAISAWLSGGDAPARRLYDGAQALRHDDVPEKHELVVPLVRLQLASAARSQAAAQARAR